MSQLRNHMGHPLRLVCPRLADGRWHSHAGGRCPLSFGLNRYTGSRWEGVGHGWAEVSSYFNSFVALTGSVSPSPYDGHQLATGHAPHAGLRA